MKRIIQSASCPTPRCDEQDRHLEPNAELAQESENLDLYGHIQCGGGFVGDQNLRPAAQRNCDHEPLVLAAGYADSCILGSGMRTTSSSPGERRSTGDSVMHVHGRKQWRLGGFTSSRPPHVGTDLVRSALWRAVFQEIRRAIAAAEEGLRRRTSKGQPKPSPAVRSLPRSAWAAARPLRRRRFRTGSFVLGSPSPTPPIRD